MYTYIHTCIYIHVRTHTHIHIYTHAHTKCTYERTQARLERQCGSERARSRYRRRKPCTSLSFDAIKPQFAPPIQELQRIHFLKHQYPSTPHPLFPTYPRTVRAPGASAVLLFYTDQMNRVHSSEEAPRKIGGKRARSSPSRNHDSAAPRQHPLICTVAEAIHQVRDPPKLQATESMLRNRIHIFAIFPPFTYVYIYLI